MIEICDESERTDSNDITMKVITICKEYLEKIEYQAATTQPDINPDDIVLQYIKNELGIDNEEKIHDHSILIDDSLTELDKNLLSSFKDGLNFIFNKAYGISIYDNDIRLSYYTYLVLTIKFIDYFVDYIDGLQQIDAKYQDDIPNFQEVSFKYFQGKHNNETDKLELISNYIDYIIEYCIFPDLYYEIALLGSPGNEILSCLYLESSNGRIEYDSDFFKLKIGKIISSNIKEALLPRIYDILVD